MSKMCSMKLVYNCCSYYCRVTNHSTFGSLEQLFCSWFCVSGVQESLSWALSIGGLESSEYSSESDFQNSIFTWLTVGWELSWGCQCEHLRSPSQHGRLSRFHGSCMVVSEAVTPVDGITSTTVYEPAQTQERGADSTSWWMSITECRKHVWKATIFNIIINTSQKYYNNPL